MFSNRRQGPGCRGDTRTIGCYQYLLAVVVSRTFVGLQISSSLKCLGTFITLEWQLSSVSLHVSVKVPLVLQLGRVHAMVVDALLRAAQDVSVTDLAGI